MIAPPTPCSARASAEERRVLAQRRTAASRSVKTTIPTANTRRRPARSAIEPAVSSSAASVSA